MSSAQLPRKKIDVKLSQPKKKIHIKFIIQMAGVLLRNTDICKWKKKRQNQLLFKWLKKKIQSSTNMSYITNSHIKLLQMENF